MQSVRKPDLGLEENIGMMKTIFVNHPERSSVSKNKESYRKVRGSGSEPRTDNVRESAMTLTCHNNCKKPGHKKRVCKELMGKSDKPSDAENGTRNGAHTITLIGIQMRTAISSSSSWWEGGARITRAQLTRMISAIIRDMVAVTLPLTVKVQKMRRSLQTVT